LCGGCEVVQTARQDQDQETAALVRGYEKSPLLPVDSVATLIAPPRVSHVLRAARARCPSAWTVAPPVPPPRARVRASAYPSARVCRAVSSLPRSRAATPAVESAPARLLRAPAAGRNRHRFP